MISSSAAIVWIAPDAIAQQDAMRSTQGAPSGGSSATDQAQTAARRSQRAALPIGPGPATPADPHLLGDWLGVRATMATIGLTPIVQYLGQGLFAARGGGDKTAQFAGQLTLGIAADLAKTTGGALPGIFQVAFTRRHGASFNATSGLNLLVNPQSVSGRGEIWRVTQFWYRTTTAGVDIKLGRLQFNEDFNQARCDFISGYFCLGENTRAAPTAWPTTPVSQWGIRLQHRLARDVTVKIGAYQYNPRNLDGNRPMFFGFDGATGVTVPAELSYTPLLGPRLPGSYTLGLAYANAPLNDAVLNANGQLRSLFGGAPLLRQAGWSGWVDVRQQIVAPARNGAHALSVFFNLSIASSRTANNVSVFGAGINYTGALPGRPRDEIGIALGRARLNDRVTDAARDAQAVGALVPVRTSEHVVEAYYGMALAAGLTISPDVQFVFDPAGDASRRNAILLGVRTAVIL